MLPFFTYKTKQHGNSRTSQPANLPDNLSSKNRHLSQLLDSGAPEERMNEIRNKLIHDRELLRSLKEDCGSRIMRMNRMLDESIIVNKQSTSCVNECNTFEIFNDMIKLIAY
ncbi:hypothetical protein CBL_14253 [Carabus blaptoides fortunei]